MNIVGLVISLALIGLVVMIGSGLLARLGVH